MVLDLNKNLVCEELLRKMYIDEKMTCKEIARELGYSQPQVYCILKKLNIPIDHYGRRKHLKRKSLNCLNCKKDFLVELWRPNPRFCSKKCSIQYCVGEKSHSWKGGNILVFCDFCNKKKSIEKWEIKMYKKHFCSVECRGKWRSKYILAEKHPNWTGGKFKTSDGYITVYSPNHLFKDGDGYVKEHRLVCENFIGRYLTKDEVIHHINKNRTDNRIENLMIFPSSKEHMKLHTKIRQFGFTQPILTQIENRWECYKDEAYSNEFNNVKSK